MQSRKKMFQTVTKFLLVLLAVGASLGVMSHQKAQAATSYRIGFYAYMGETNDSGTYIMTQIGDYQWVEKGKTLARPTDPTRTGYVFDNWYTDASFSTPFDFSAPINSSKSIYGRWVKSVQFTAYNESDGSTGGGKIAINGSFPNSGATQAGPSASLTQILYDEYQYTFSAVPNDGFYFRGWCFNDPTDNPLNIPEFSFPVMALNAEYGDGNLQNVYAIFAPIATDTETWKAKENRTSEFKREYTVTFPGQYAEELLVLEDNNNITQTRWEGLTAEGKTPDSGSAKFIITLKDNVARGFYNVVLYDNVTPSITNVTIVVGHDAVMVLPTAATCNTSGNHKYWKCESCDLCFSDEDCTVEVDEEDMQIPALGHAYGEWESISDTKHRRHCTRVYAHYETKNHTWDNGVITTQPTTTAEGVKTLTCTGCGHTKTENVPIIVNTFTIRYHQTENSAASNTTTSVEYGKSTKTIGYEKLGFGVDGQNFKGWKVYRADTQCWRVVNRSGVQIWSKTVPEGGSYYLYTNEIEVSKTAPAGSEVHFYGQWE